MKHTIAVDYDGTLELNNGKPNLELIKWLMTQDSRIMVYTSRDWLYYEYIKHNLEMWKVPFDGIICGKLLADIYIDDRAVLPEEIVKKKKGEERTTNETPEPIKVVYAFPYEYFPEVLEIDTCLDLGCGYPHRELEGKFDVIFADIDPKEPDVIAADMTKKLPFGDDAFDAVFCFEAIEHIEFSQHAIALKEMFRVASKYVVIGSTAADGVKEVGGHIIFKATNGMNDFHLSEMTTQQFYELMVAPIGWEAYCLQSEYPPKMVLVTPNSKNVVSNYIIFERKY